jgi:hypothetical protein
MVIPHSIVGDSRSGIHVGSTGVEVSAASILPYSGPVLDLVRAEAASARPVILATGAHERVAQDVAGHVGLFSGVFATNGPEHLVGRLKPIP